MTELDHLALAKQFSVSSGLSWQLSIAHALIAIAERLPEPKPLEVDAYSGHHTYTNEQM